MTRHIPSVTPEEIARHTAQMLLDAEAVHLNTAQPFILASGLPSPTYIDCRKLNGFPGIRSVLLDYLATTITRDAGCGGFDNIAGGETAGIPLAAVLADRMALPMSYIRKKPKGYGRNARIEGIMTEGQRVLLVEDLATDGASKLSFVEAIRETGAVCHHTAVIFHYDIFPQSRRKLGEHDITLHHLCTWWDVLSQARDNGKHDPATLMEVEAFLHDPQAWQEKAAARFSPH